MIDRPTARSASEEGERVTQGPIENPVRNSPFVEPAQHFVPTADGTAAWRPRRCCRSG
ncbi:MAG: hypothetical protein Q7S35_12915 [Candidatus Limnocylindrales bacterium]|nr:hypothetical protein [Candidatus Limnocylindrales bacterium]